MARDRDEQLAGRAGWHDPVIASISPYSTTICPGATSAAFHPQVNSGCQASLHSLVLYTDTCSRTAYDWQNDCHHQIYSLLMARSFFTRMRGMQTWMSS